MKICIYKILLVIDVDGDEVLVVVAVTAHHTQSQVMLAVGESSGVDGSDSGWEDAASSPTARKIAWSAF